MMKKAIFWILYYLIFFAALEISSNILMNSLNLKAMNYDFAVKFKDKIDLFKEIKEGGVLYYTSDYFPSSYYSHMVDFKDKGNTFLKSKTDDIFRIFVYGGSTAAGSPFGHWTSFPKYLKDVLEAQKISSHTKVELMNFGTSSIGSTRILDLISKTIQYEPDLVILYTGDNEITDNVELFLDGKSRLKDSDLRFKIKNTVLKHSGFARLTFYTATRLGFFTPTYTLNSLIETDEINHYQVFKNISKETRLAEFNQIFKTNISKIVQIVTGKKIPLVLMSSVSNDTYAPSISYSNDEKLTLLEKQIVESRINIVDRENTIKKLLELDNQNALAHYFKGLSYLETGDKTNAQKYFSLAKDQDPFPNRARPEYLTVYKEIAKENLKVFYIDSENYLREQVPDGIIDGRLMVDRVHPNITGAKHLVDAILKLYFQDLKMHQNLFQFSKITSNHWGLTIKPSDYSVICERYLKDYKPWGWSNCLPLLENVLAQSKNEGERRFNNRIWEFYLYKGVEEGNRKLIEKASKFYPIHKNQNDFKDLTIKDHSDQL